MKKRLYLLISSICQITASLYCLIASKIISKMQIQTLKNFLDVMPENSKELYEKLISLLEKNGSIVIIILAAICLILNTYILLIAANNKITKKKTLLIILSVVCLLIDVNTTITLLSIVNIIVLAVSKNEKEVKEKEVIVTKKTSQPVKQTNKIPVAEPHKVNKSKIILAITMIIAYIALMILPGFVDNEKLSVALSVISYISLIVISLMIFKDEFKRDLPIFKSNFKSYLKYCLGKIGIMYCITIGVNTILILTSLKSTTETVNQTTVSQMPIIPLILLATIYAPIVEESVFRGSIRRFIKNNIAFIIISGILFGAIHVVNEPNLLDAIINSISYAVMGGMFAYVYSKTNNIYTNILCHFMCNVFAVIVIIIL